MDYREAFEKLYELEGGLVVLRPVAPEMAEALFEANDESREELRRFMPWDNKDVNDLAEFIARSQTARDAGTGLNLAVIDRADGVVCGVIGLSVDPFTPRGAVGYWIRTSRTRRGLASDAASTLLKYCRDELGLVRVDASVAAENVASQGVMRKCGFVEEGLKKRAELCHGVWHDLKLFGILFE